MEKIKIGQTKGTVIHALSVMIFFLILAGCDNATSPNNDQLNTYNTPVTTQTGDVINSMNDELSIYTVEGFYFLEPMVNNS